MSEGAAIGVLLWALIIGLPVGTLIGAVCLRAAVALYNKLAGGASSPSSVPKPAFGKAMWISFESWVWQIVAGALIGGVTGLGARAVEGREQEIDVVAPLISLAVSLLIMVGVLSAKLPTTFGRAILVTLCEMLVVLLVVGVLAAIAVVVLGLALSRP